MCCAASCAAPCAMRSCSAPREPLMWRLVPALVREMGQAYPELVRGEALITETLKLEETRFRKTLARGLGLLARRPATLGDGDMLDGETAFKLYDTYGFPLDLTQDALRQRGIARRYSTASTTRWSGRRPRRARAGPAPARRRPKRSGSRCATRPARPSSSATRPRRPKASSLALVKDGEVVDERRAKARRSASSSTRRRSTASPAARWATPASISGEGFRVDVTDTQKKADGLFVHLGKVAKGTVKTGAAVELEGRSRAPHAAALQPFGDASAPRGAARGAGHPCRAEGLAGRARAAALRLLASASRCRPRSSKQVEEMANEIVVQNSAGHDAADERRRRDRRRRDGAVRREIWRRGARRLDGHRHCTATRPASPIRSSSAAAPMSARPATSAWCASSRESAVARRRAPHRGADRRGGAPPSRRAGRAAEGGRRGAEGRAGRRAGARRGAGRRAPQARARAGRGAQEAGARRRRRQPAPATQAETVAGVGFLGRRSPACRRRI